MEMGENSHGSKPSSKGRLTPAMAQFVAIKSQYPDCILFFHIGDFYETFGKDAETISRELDIVLTSRSKDSEGNRIPLAGVPCHAADGYIARLVARGYRVAVCDQVEDARNAKGIVKREVVRVITPGTVMEESLLGSAQAQYLMALVPGEKPPRWGMAFLDLSTGQFFTTVCARSGGEGELISELSRYSPAECLVPEDLTGHVAEMISARGVLVTRRPREIFDHELAYQALCEHFGVVTLEGYGITDTPVVIPAAGAALVYARETQKSSLSHVSGISTRNSGDFCTLDAITLRNLEVLESIRGRQDEATLLHTLNRTKTPMGSRLLRNYLCAPLTSVPVIMQRLDAVEFFSTDTPLRTESAALLKKCSDIERIAARIAFGNAGPRDLITLKQSLGFIPALKSVLSYQDREETIPYLISEACGRCRDLDWIESLIKKSIVDDPPAMVRNGGVICEGYSTGLDDLRAITSSGKDWIKDLQRKERERTGIKSLKVGYNSVFGYYIEVTRPNLHLVPPEYNRKQTTTNAERFTIPELKEKEAVIASADERLISLEQEIFQEIISMLTKGVRDLQDTAAGIAEIDVYVSFAESAAGHNYVRPVVDESGEILIREGRHPVVEQRMSGSFVPNDARTSSKSDQILIITGANMAGKSTYMRGVALIAVMAQAGSFVPATHARIGVIDRVFTRVGAFDDLASGQSTFMVEMLEMANILNNVTPRSLVILDEIGRGTSTLDGFCIARAVLDFLHGKGTTGPRTLFATHFHELVSAEAELKRVKNYHFAVKDTGKEVIFLRKLIPGATDRSYGIHVASLAGVPRKVITRANELLAEMMRSDQGTGVTIKRFTQMLLVDPGEGSSHPLVEEIKSINPDSLTPLEALTFLYELHKKAQDGG
ncbi:MAG TPA: DNA mismatch repair protein MutS [Methanoregulaceae archaeon]|nr:DNA mismatch repair protein MutS [Methanoregulaceae archaeon]